MGRLPEAWIAPPAVRELRELVRHRAKLVIIRSGFKAGVHAILAKQGLHLPVKELFGPRGRAELAAAPLDRAYRARLNAYLRIVDTLDTEIVMADGWITARLTRDAGYQVIQQIPGVGPVWAAVFVAEIGDVTRFASARHLCSWAGLTPRHRESDTTVHRGPITKQGSALVRWAAIEAVQRIPASAGWLVATRAQIAERRGRNIATVAVARRLLDAGLLRAARRAHPRFATLDPQARSGLGSGAGVIFGRIGRVVAAESGSRQLAASRGLD